MPETQPTSSGWIRGIAVALLLTGTLLFFYRYFSPKPDWETIRTSAVEQYNLGNLDEAERLLVSALKGRGFFRKGRTAPSIPARPDRILHAPVQVFRGGTRHPPPDRAGRKAAGTGPPERGRKPEQPGGKLPRPGRSGKGEHRLPKITGHHGKEIRDGARTGRPHQGRVPPLFARGGKTAAGCSPARCGQHSRNREHSLIGRPANRNSQRLLARASYFSATPSRTARTPPLLHNSTRRIWMFPLTK